MAVIRRARCVAMLVIVLLVASACSGGGGRPATTTTSLAPRPKLVIGMAQRRLVGGDWYQVLVAGARAAAAEAGAQLVVTDAGGDIGRQITDVQTLLGRHARAVILDPAHPSRLAPAVAALGRARVPLVLVHSPLDSGLAGAAFCAVADDQSATAAKVGSALGNLAKRRFKGGHPVKAVVVGGVPGDTSTKARQAGFLAGYNAVPGAPPIDLLPLRYGRGSPDQAATEAKAVIKANPDLGMVFSSSDVMLPGVSTAIKAAHLEAKVLIGSDDGSMSVARLMIDDPAGPVQADVSSLPFEQGRIAVEMAIAAARGDRSACPDGRRQVEGPLITPKTAKTFYNPDRPY